MLARIHALNNTDSSEESDSGESDNEFTLTKEALVCIIHISNNISYYFHIDMCTCT